MGNFSCTGQGFQTGCSKCFLNVFCVVTGFYLAVFSGTEGGILKVEYVNINNFWETQRLVHLLLATPLFSWRAVVSEFAKHSDSNFLSSLFKEMDNLCLLADMDGSAGVSLFPGPRPEDFGSSLVERVCYPWLHSGINKYFLCFGIFPQSFDPFLYFLWDKTSSQ